MLLMIVTGIVTSSYSVITTLTLANSLAQSRQGLTELPWTDFFDQELFLQQYTEDLLVMHHAYMTPPTRGKAPLFVTHHGAGSSGLSFAPLAVELLKVLPGAGILSLDARGHGKTVITPLERVEGTIENRDYADLTLGTLGHDLEFVVNAMRERMKWEALPDIILVGHSLGGAVVTDLAKNGGLGSKILGYAVLDVVEGESIVQ
jgi:protein phosphatase methylesterase 1